MVKRLLRYGANVDLLKIVSGEAPLMHGELEDYIKVCKEFLQHKDNIKQVYRDSNTPLIASAMNGKVASIRLLVLHRALL
jgi:ankyrin repeat protein